MEDQDIVAELQTLLGPDVLLLHCKSGSKKPIGKWKGLTLDSMADPAYLARLRQGNIGVVLGERSGGLCSLDIDSDDGLSVFSKLNDGICQTLCTRGARGCNFWWKLNSPYPALTPLKLNGDAWGEWRSDGAQTVIWGSHPNGVRYQWLRRVKPLVIGFDEIKWPHNLKPRLSQTEADVTQSTQQTQSTKSPERTEPTDGTQANTCGKGMSVSFSAFATFEQVLAVARATGPHANHSRLFTLARGAKAVQLARNQTITDGELRELFDRWYGESKPHLRHGLGRDDYWFEFIEAFENVKHPLGTGVVEAAWNKAVQALPPPEAEQFDDLALRQVVCLCREMWISGGRKPFFLSCRTLQRLLGHPDHVRAARWLRGLCRSKILRVVELGGAKGRKATRYRYLPTVET